MIAVDRQGNAYDPKEGRAAAKTPKGELREISDLVDEYGPDDWTMKGKPSVVSKGGKEIVAVTKMDAARAYAKDVKNERFDTSKHYDEFKELYDMVDSGGPNGYDEAAEGFRYRRKSARSGGYEDPGSNSFLRERKS